MAIRSSNGSTREPDHRSSFRIIADVLRAAADTDVKSCVFRRANLNHTRGERYLMFCDDVGLLDAADDGYRITDEGRGYLSDWSHVEDYLVHVDEELDFR